MITCVGEISVSRFLVHVLTLSSMIPACVGNIVYFLDIAVLSLFKRVNAILLLFRLE